MALFSWYSQQDTVCDLDGNKKMWPEAQVRENPPSFNRLIGYQKTEEAESVYLDGLFQPSDVINASISKD